MGIVALASVHVLPEACIDATFRGSVIAGYFLPDSVQHICMAKTATCL
jgi:hypothetical protein